MALLGLPWAATAFSCVIAALAYGLMRMIHVRRFYKDLPKPPHSFLFGHLKVLGEAYAMLPSNGHYQAAATTIARKYNMPGVFYLDLWPITWGQVIVTDPDCALHMTAIRNHPKHIEEARAVDPLIGNANIVSTNGQRWKELHKMLSPAFSITHITNLRPMVADEVMKYRAILRQKSETGEVFAFETHTMCMTFDVICTATFGYSLDAQTKGSDALIHFENMCRIHIESRDSLNFVRNFFVHRRRDAERDKWSAILAKLIRERFEIVKSDKLNLSDKRGLGIMDLILREYVQSGATELDARFMEDALTQVRTMFSAGSSTTSDTICFAFMLLSINPDAVRKMREEHDRVFTMGIEATYEMLKAEPYKLNQLTYTTGVIKEVLRFFPIGNTAREGIDTIPYNGAQWPTKGLMICPVQMHMHMNPEIFLDPMKFDPERFEREDFPRHAWRPFERGPRACLGQPLALDELLITFLLIVRDFDFTCADLKPNKTPRTEWSNLDLSFGDRAYQEFLFEARPRDGMPMTVKKSNWPS
ncbi:hypothetical protein PTNB73_09764 [Pyrenophora teres f. teres]|nr:hypothetical protein HRS9122_08547 [Pyrenophora teres f. teres]KAE8856499.1 hypothetical protein PTNB73_09764 [Pyrenophora teres f. teres]